MPVDHLEGIGCKSCEHPDITMTHSDQVKLWDYHKNGDDNPKNYTSGSAKKVWWICLTNCKFGCSHTHLQSINSKCGNRNTGCPYCCIPRKQSCIHDRISTTHPEVAKQWHPTLNGYKKADDFTFGSSYQAYWQCPKNINHTWKTYISSRCRLRVGCPDCRNKTEAKLLDFLKKHYPDIFTQLKLESCKNITYLPLDFCIPSLKIIIELDGIQHFKQVSNWASPEESIQRDIYKMKQAEAEGYKIIRIFQEDVYDNDETWLETHLLPEIKNTDRNHMFISVLEDLYDEHIKVYETT
jgi:very-short-patch-repair endonuclease